MADILWTPRLQAAAAGLGASLQGAQDLAGDGSDRRFFRLLGSPTVVLLHHPQPTALKVNENDSYFHLGRHLRRQGAPVPEIYEYCREEGWLLLEDLGDIHLAAAVARENGGEQLRYWYRQALDILVTLQVGGKEGFDPAWCFDTAVMHRPFLWERECGYFVRAYLQGYAGLKLEMDDLAPDFERLLTRALPPAPNFFLHRDFQSRNLMIKNGRIRVIDFQGGRLGPLGYDLAALLIDPYVNLKPLLQEELLAAYLDLLEERLPGLDRQAFQEQYWHLALCRNLQILGAFGYLTRERGKSGFSRYIPAALAGLRRRLGERPGEFPLLEQAIVPLI
ncbi:MAG: aminoglycoside phosphotransferase family protein [Desulfobaccales bacterium]